MEVELAAPRGEKSWLETAKDADKSAPALPLVNGQ